MADANHQFVLLEAAAGYALFEVVAFEEIGSLLEGNKDTVVDLGRFKRAVNLVAFQPFESAADALENANAVSEHAMTDTLRSFLEGNLPAISNKKKKKEETAAFALGVIDPGLATAIAEGLPGMACRSDDVVRELVRGCRLHLSHFVRGLDHKGGGGNAAILQAQLGLGHSYSRSKVKFNPARSDNMIIQSIALLDQMDKDLNTFAMRIREWYSWHFPELKDIVKDNYMFARCAALIQDKTTLSPSAAPERKNNRDEDDDDDDDDDEDEEDDDGPNGKGDTKTSEVEEKFQGLVTITGDRDTANAVVAAAKTSMGVHCSAVDMVNIVNFTQRMIKLAEYRKQLGNYLQDKMKIVAPNLAALIGDTVAARLISKAGSLTNLAKSPASTVQILGAEKALFRALKTKGNTPKYGLIYHSTFIGRADSKNKGRISRYLANKCSLATRIDSFSDEPTAVYGEMLREQVEERLKFYETGASPRKNADVMASVAKRLREEADLVADQQQDDDNDDMEEDDTPKKKKKKEKEKKKKKKKSKGGDDDDDDETMKEDDDDDDDDTPKKKKKKKKKKDKKSKKRKSMEDDDGDEDDEDEAAKPKSAKKAKKKSNDDDVEDDAPSSDKKKKKKDKKKKKKKSME